VNKAELQEKLAEQAARIAKLEKQVEELEADVRESEGEIEEFRQEVGSHAAALFAALDERVPFHTLPICLRLDFEGLAERLDVMLPLRRVS
jgi:predicted  nucleic acid-binding Zn-ribbon protein